MNNNLIKWRYSALVLITMWGVASQVAGQNRGLLREVYNDIPGTTIADLVSAPVFPDRPSLTEVLTNAFESPIDINDNYGQRLSGFIIAPLTGPYVFWISSDDQSVLSLSTNDNPAMKFEIAGVGGWTYPREWDREPNQMSAPIQLEAGQHYYLEALMKEEWGGDNLAVRWQWPDGTIEEPIPADRMIPANQPVTPPYITVQPTNFTAQEGGKAVFRVAVGNRDPVGYQWRRHGVAIRNAVSAAYTNQAVSVLDQGERYSCIITNSLGAVVSQEAVLTVIPDTLSPILSAVFSKDSRTVTVVFSEPVQQANVAANYSLDKGAAVLSAAFETDARNSVVLTTTPLAIQTTYTLTVNHVTDRSSAANPVAPNTTRAFTTTEFAPQGIGQPAFIGTLSPVANGYNLMAGGTNIGGTNDQFFFSYQSREGNFDLQVRLQSLSPTDPWAKAGLMARESLQPTSPFASVMATPNLGGCFVEYRPTNSAPSVMLGAFPVSFPVTWLRLQRSGNQFSGFASIDGKTWTPLGSATLALTNIVYFGFAVDSHNAAVPTLAEFRDLATVTNAVLGYTLPPGFEPLGPSSRRTGLVISEIMYHPSARADGRELEFIELFNADSTPEDLSGFRLAGQVDYTFPAGALLPPGRFAVLALSPVDLGAVYGVTNVMGPYHHRLNNRAGTLRLLNAVGAVLLETRYDSEPPWPAAADGGGHSLVLARPSYGEGRPEAWAPSRFIGGSPGVAEVLATDPLDAVMINELLVHTDDPILDYIELYNHSNEPVDLSNCSLSDDPGADKYVFPPGTHLVPRGFLAITQDHLGFALSAAGEAIFLKNAQRSRVVDALRFGPQANGIALGRYPDGAPVFRPLSARSPGASNRGLLFPDVVINEIMYNPLTGHGDDEYVELYNRTTNAIPLGHWRFVAGLDYTLPDQAIIPARGYLVVAKNAGHLIASHTNLTSATVVGDFPNSLAKGGERLALARPEDLVVTNADLTLVTNRVYVVVNEVAYRDGGRWGHWSDGGGSSLELTDPNSDNRLPSNWADSDETSKSEWTHLEFTGVLNHGRTNYGIGSIEILMLEAGECLVDNVEVFDGNGVNLVPNSAFESGLFGWTLRGNHKYSNLQDGGGYNSRRCLRVVASGRGDTGPNQIFGQLNTPLREGNVATIRAKVRWLRGHPEILFRLHGNFLEATGPMQTPAGLGTPGAPNSRLVKNAGPAIFDVAHYPVLPMENQSVRITARVQDPQGLAAVTLNYRFDPSVTAKKVPMLDNGAGGDAVGGDGIYTAQIPGQAAGVLAAFSVEATDVAVPAVKTTFPNDAPVRECLVMFGEKNPAGSLPTYRIWVTQDTFNEWSTRESGSNHPLDGTFAYGNWRAVYNVGALYSGSPFHWGGYDTPTGNLCNYLVVFPPDDPLLGTSDYVLNAPSNLGSDSTAIREQTTHWMATQMGLPATYRRFVHLFFNGVRRSFIFEDAQQPSREFVEEWFPGDAKGDLHKIEDWFEYNDSFGFVNQDATLEKFSDTDGQLKKARYRYTWRKRAVQGSANDYRRLFELVTAVNIPASDAYETGVQAAVDIEQWLKTMAIRHAVGDWDAYGYRRGKNMYAYKPVNGPWQLLNWDISFAFGLGDGATADLFEVRHFDGLIDPITDRMFKHPAFRRMYLRAFQDIVNGPFLNAQVDPVMEAKFAALKENGVTVSSPASIKSWIASRRAYIQRVLATNSAPFAITSNDGQSFRTDQNPITLAGTAPVLIKTIRVNGVVYPAHWSTVTNWSLSVPLKAGQNQLVVQGFDSQDRPVTSATGQLDVTFTGTVEAIQDHVVFNEIMYHSDVTGAEYVEIHNTSFNQSFDLSKCVINGLDFTFADGTIIAPQGFLVVAQNRVVFRDTYGSDIPVAGEYAGRLDRGGETLSLIKPGPTSAEDLLIDQVKYDDVPPWPTLADGTGISLQLIDPTQDNQRVGNWTAVNTNGFTEPIWQYVAVTGTGTGSRLSLFLDSPGEVFLDDLNLVAGIFPRVGPNLLRNGDFEEPLEGAWQAHPLYAASGLNTGKHYSGAASLRLVAAAGSANETESVGQDLTPPLIDGQYYTLSYWYLPGPYNAQLTVKLAGLGLTSSHGVAQDRLAYRTPGQPNSVRASLPPFPALWINEVQPQNTTGLSDNAGQRDPWIELYNAGPTSANLAGYSLADNYTNLTQWIFPANTVLAPKQFLVVWADGEPGQSTATELHANFRLASTNGSVALARLQNQQPAVVDYLNYPSVLPGWSYGLYPDGRDRGQQSFDSPTPGATNHPAATPTRIVINEWMAGNTGTVADPADGDFDDWFELYNPGPAAVDLGGFTLTDTLSDPRKFVIPNHWVIPPQGFMLIWADDETRQNEPDRELHVNFKLSQSGDSIGLFTPGGAMVDAVTFGQQQTDASQGRWPDGQSGVAYGLPTPTPRAPNSKPSGISEGPRVIGFSVSSDSVTITFQSEVGRSYRAQFKDDLLNPAWSDIGTPVTAQSEVTTVVDTSAGGHAQRYYRVIANAAP